MSSIRLALLAFAACVAGLVQPPPAFAQGAAPAGALTGTLKKIRDSGAMTIGYREASVPFSYVDANGRPAGYSIELCLAILDDVRAELDNPDIQVRYRRVGVQDRIARVVDGTVDLECGVTTINAERQKQVAFSPVFFVSGTRLLARRGAGIRSWRDLRGRTVAVLEATTNQAALDALRRRERLDFRMVQVGDHDAAFAAVQAGQADAWAGDDVLLYGYIARADNPREFVVLGDYLSYDPYGIVYRKGDADFDALVRGAFGRLAASRELAHLYDRWFMRRQPFGPRPVGVPMSAHLRSVFESLGQPAD